MKKLLFFIPIVLFFACNGDNKKESKEAQHREMIFFAPPVAPIIDSTKITPNGDTIIYKHTVETGTYSYNLPSVEVRLKGTVTPPVNLPPTAVAGSDVTITLPVSTVKLDASGSTDPESQTLKFFWRQTAGPTLATVVDSNKVICTVSNLKAGSYTFEVRAVDPLNAFSADFITITVKPEVVTPPTGSPVPFSFTPIPFSNADLNAPGRGVEQWHNFNLVNIPSEGTNTQRLDVYYRSPLTWAKIEKSQGVYDWSPVINMLNDAISKRQKVTLGFMSVYHDNEDGVISYDGFRSAYPQYLHNLMQSESVKDWHNNSGWIPNYNSTHYTGRLRAFNSSLNNLIETGSSNGVPYKHVINSIDVRGYGNYGEWHNGGLVDQVSQIPSGAHATTATLKAIIDAHTQTIPNFQLNIIMTAFDANFLQHTKTSPEVAYYALTTKNNYGKLGWRRDNWGAGDISGDTYIDDLLIDNNRTWNGVTLSSLIMKVWEYAPITGEPMNTSSSNYSDLENQVRKYHATSFGNGNIWQTITTAIKDNVRRASKAAGYRLIVSGGTFTPGSSSISVTTNWQNVGIAPTYENWNIEYQLVNSAGTITTLGVSNFKLRLFLPASTATSHTDVFPLSVPAGSYTLRMVIKDPTGYRAPLPLAIPGRNSDGSYNLKSFQR